MTDDLFTLKRFYTIRKIEEAGKLSPVFFDKKVFLFSIENENGVEVGEEWEVEYVEIKDSKKLDKRGQKIFVVKTLLKKRREQLQTDTDEENYRVVSGSRVLEEGKISSLLEKSKIDRIFVGGNRIQLKIFYNGIETIVSVKEEYLPPQLRLVVQEEKEKRKKAEEVRNEKFVSFLHNQFARLKERAEEIIKNYPPRPFNPFLKFTEEEISTTFLPLIRLRVVSSSQNVFLSFICDEEVERYISPFKYANYDVQKYPFPGKGYFDRVKESLKILTEVKQISFIPQVPTSNNWYDFRDFPENFWEVYNTNYDTVFERIDWRGDGEIEISLFGDCYKIRAKKKIFRDSLYALLWFENPDLSFIEDETMKSILLKKLTQKTVSVRLRNFTVYRASWESRNGKSVEHILKEKGFITEYAVVNEGDNRLYDEEGNAYAVVPWTSKNRRMYEVVRIYNPKKES